MKPSFARRALQIATFLRKEAVDILHQPRLLVTLVFGPFLIMAVFGLGYRDTPAPMRTLFVAPAGSPLLQQMQEYAGDTGPFVEVVGVSNDLTGARRRLSNNELDLIVSFPDDPLPVVLNGEQAVITIIHTRLDPIERTAINFASQLAVDEINGQILAAVVEGGQGLAGPAKEVFAVADRAISRLDASIQTGDEAESQAALTELDDVGDRLSVSARAIEQLSQRLVENGAKSNSAPALGQNSALPKAMLQTVAELRSAVVDVRATVLSQDLPIRVSRLRELVTTAKTTFDQVSTIDAGVLVRPFRSDVELAVSNVGNITDWYAPAAVVLMLQQFGVAFGALSFVRERQLGIVDVYRVAPINAAETLIGKYLAYLVIGGGIGALLTGLVVTVLDVPIASGLGDVALVMGLTLFAAIGLGFVISLASAGDAQAVQYTMIVLLASLFFSGFFLSIGQLEGMARIMGWLLPVTYGMELLRDVMLRGAAPDRALVGGLAAYSAVMFMMALLGTRRRLAVAR